MSIISEHLDVLEPTGHVNVPDKDGYINWATWRPEWRLVQRCEDWREAEKVALELAVGIVVSYPNGERKQVAVIDLGKVQRVS